MSGFEVVGLLLGVTQLGADITTLLAAAVKNAINVDAEDIRDRLEHERLQFEGLLSLLLDRNGICVDLSPQRQRNLERLLRRINGLFYAEYPELVQFCESQRNGSVKSIASPTTNPLDTNLTAPNTVNSGKEAIGLRKRLVWGFWDRRKAVALANQLEIWIRRFREAVTLYGNSQDLWRPRTSMASKSTRETISRFSGIQEASDLKQKIETMSTSSIASGGNMELIRFQSLKGGGRRIGPVEIAFLDGRKVLLEKRREFPRNAAGAVPEEFTLQQRKLTALLKIKKPSETFRLMACQGYIELPDQYALVYGAPTSETCIATLHDTLGTERRRHPLGFRFQLAKRLAAAVANWNALGWVHKNLRSDNILLISHDKGKYQPELWLFGFETARPIEDASIGTSETHSSAELYIHPDRSESSYGVVDFVPMYDIYSLGVMLLEIGLWKSAADIVSGTSRGPRKTNSEKLVDATEKSLGFLAGDRYASIVLKCLNGKFFESVDGEGKRDWLAEFDTQVVTVLEEMSQTLSGSP